ncbi:MAG: alkaline phosphatase [Halobacteriovoraceae bacterium]|nr:alkaline phosphatase [Halobacteriovoraceae bacterium]
MEHNRRKFLQFLGYGSLLIGKATLLGPLSGCTKFKIPSLSPTSEDKLILAPGLNYSIIAKFVDSINEKEVFGFNNDYIDFLALSPNDLILWINHEYVHPLWVNGYERTKANMEKERKLVGGTLMRVKKINQKWEMQKNDIYNRGVRGDTPIPFADNVEVLGSKIATGTLANCAGGKTPWDTILTCEENYYGFYGERSADGSVTESLLNWQTHFPNPPEHYGWVVEVEPKTGKAKKHTSLGRFAHESATCSMSKNNKCVVYSGDDKNDEHLYKFISDSSNSLERGTLYVANLDKGEWMPLTIENPKLKGKFKNQLDILIHARKASKLLGATKLDRPEDIEINKATGDIFIACTNNKPKKNYHGQILKIQESEADHGSLKFTASTFKTGGHDSGFTCPDNMVFDNNGNLWFTNDIAGNAANKGPYKGFGNNGLFIVPAGGPQAGEVIQLASAPIDAELTGPCFSPDYKTLFLSVQHPGETSKDLKNPTSTWPDGKRPTPAIVAIEGDLLEKITG